jgi:hypothetical protein
MPALMGYQVLSIFLISGILRGATSLIFLPRLKEVRKVSTVPAAQLFHILTGGRPVDRRLSHRRVSFFHHHEPGIEDVSKPTSEQS